MSKQVKVEKGEVWEDDRGCSRRILIVVDSGGAVTEDVKAGCKSFWSFREMNDTNFHKLISKGATIHAHMHCGPFGDNPQRHFECSHVRWKYVCSQCGKEFWTEHPCIFRPACPECIDKAAKWQKVDWNWEGEVSFDPPSLERAGEFDEPEVHFHTQFGPPYNFRCTGSVPWDPLPGEITVSFDFNPPPEVGEVYYDKVRKKSFEIDDKYTRVSDDSQYHVVWNDGHTRWFTAEQIHERGKLIRPVTTNYRCTDVPFTPESDEEEDALQASCYRCGKKYRINLRESPSLRKYCSVCGWEMIMGKLPKIGDVHPSHSQFFYAVCQKCGSSLGYVPRGYQQLCGDCIKQMLDLFKAKLKPKPSKIDSLKVHQVWESPRDRVRYKIISYAWDGKEVTSVLTETVCSRMRINWPREEAIKHVFGTLIEDASLPEIEPGQKWGHVDKANFVIVGDHPTKKWAVVIDNGFMLTVMARKIIKEECWLISPAKKEG